MPVLETTGLNNVDYRIDYPVKGPTTVLLFFSPSCPHCKAMIPEWNKAFAAKPEGLKVLGVAMERPPEAYFAAVPVSFPVVIAGQPRQMSRDINLQHVPLAVRVAPGGQVEDVAAGEVPAERVQKLFAPPAR
jgi:thiol-disulfide isomerase/thioredoxin